MDIYNKAVALGLLMSILSVLPLESQDGDTSQASPYSSLQEIPSDIPPNPYNNYPYFNNPSLYYNSPPGYYSGYPNYYNSTPGYNNRYQNQNSPYSLDQRNYQENRNQGQGSWQNSNGNYGSRVE
jgi:hypothetical protein